MFFLLGDSLESEFCVPTFRNTLSVSEHCLFRNTLSVSEHSVSEHSVCFGTLCLFWNTLSVSEHSVSEHSVCSVFIGGVSRKNNRDKIVGVFIREKIWLENSLSQSDGGGTGRGFFVRVENQAVEGKDLEWTRKKKHNSLISTSPWLPFLASTHRRFSLTSAVPNLFDSRSPF